MPYTVNEMFCSIQGEGARSGSRNVFVRFAGCNLSCSANKEGFDCDTDFTSIYKRYRTPDELVEETKEAWGDIDFGKAVILTGGEPALQVDEALIAAYKLAGFYVAIETNGTKPLPSGLDWVSCSPKTAEHTMQIDQPNELRYVRAIRQGIPKPCLKADHYYLSPAATADGIEKENLKWCLRLIEENPKWKLSLQMHKLIQQR